MQNWSLINYWVRAKVCSFCFVRKLIIFSLYSFRYAYPWWREKEIVSEERRLLGLCPLTPEETALVLQALGFGRDTRIYIASGEIYGSERRLSALRVAFPRIVSSLPITSDGTNCYHLFFESIFKQSTARELQSCIWILENSLLEVSY